MTGKRHLTYFFLSTIFAFTPLAANASCPNGQVKRLDEKIEKDYIIARWEGGEYAPCEYLGYKYPHQQYKCGSMPILARYAVDSRWKPFHKVISNEGVIIDTQTIKRDWDFNGGYQYTSGEPLEGVEVNEKTIGPLTHLRRLVRDYTLLSSPELPRNIEQRRVFDTYKNYRCFKVSF